MLRKIVCILSAASVLVVFGIPVRGLETTGSIRVIPMGIGNRAVSGEVALYRVGDPVVGGYRVSDGLADWIVWQREILEESFLDWAMAHTLELPIVSAVDPEIGALFEGLQEGLYLVMHQNTMDSSASFSPFLIELSTENGVNITVKPQAYTVSESPQTGDHTSPLWAAMGISLSAVVVMVLLESRKK